MLPSRNKVSKARRGKYGNRGFCWTSYKPFWMHKYHSQYLRSLSPSSDTSIHRYVSVVKSCGCIGKKMIVDVKLDDRLIRFIRSSTTTESRSLLPILYSAHKLLCPSTDIHSNNQ